MAATATSVRVALLVAAVLVAQCCNVILAARLLEGDGGWLRERQGAAGELIMQVLPKGGSGPGGNNCWQDPNHPGSGSCHN